MYRSHGMPAWVDFATEPCTSKWKTDLADPAAILLPFRAATDAGRAALTRRMAQA